MPSAEFSSEQASQGFFRWLLTPGLEVARPGQEALPPEELVDLHGRGLLTASELLCLYSYARLAARLDRRLMEKWKQLQAASDLSDEFVELFDRTVLPEAQRVDLRSVDALLKDTPASLTQSVTRTVAAYRLRSAQAPRKRLVGLRSSVFEHPSDRVALAALKAVPLMDRAIAWCVDFLKTADEMLLRGGAVAVTPASMPLVHDCFAEACAALDVSPMPPLFVREGPIGAYTTGIKTPHVVLHSATVSLLNRGELLFVMGHELGHIKAGHVLYHTLAKAVHESAYLAAPFTLGLSALVADATLLPALSLWSRRSEFTADRAGFLACQDQDVALRTFTKLAGFPPLLYGQMHPRSLVLQAESFDDTISEHGTKRFFNISNLWSASHPHTVVRARELLDWLQDGTPGELMELTPAQLRDLSARTDQDAERAEMEWEVMRRVADYAVQRFGLRRGVARKLVRQMVGGTRSAKGTELEQLLQIQFSVRRVKADEVSYTIYLLIRDNGRPVRVKIPLPRDPAWDAVPPGYRSEFNRSGEPELAWTLYTVK